MDKIFYCTNETKIDTLRLPFLNTRVSSVEEALADDCNLIILHQDFLKKHAEITASTFPDRVCLVHFEKEAPENIKIIAQCGFFDYFTNQDSQFNILFKIKRAREYISSRRRVSVLKADIESKSKKIEETVLIDPATGCYNWRYFLQRAREELSGALRHKYSISFAAVDIDYFRQINDLYGVKIADRVISDLIDILKMNLRKEDILTHWREDEFFLIMPYMSREDSMRFSRRLQTKISNYKFDYNNDIKIGIKVSIGLVSSPQDKVFNTRDIITMLDACLAAAKRKGGNKTIAYINTKQDITADDSIDVNIDNLKQKITRLNTLLIRDLLEMIYGFARAIEANDFYTGKHVETTAVIAEEIAKALNLPGHEVENVKRAAVLHDLGKVGIDQRILSKPGPLSPKERKIVNTHPWIAAEILRNIHALRGALPGILYHHERYDGKGYPLGLKGEEIPLIARIVAISDVYQALVSSRPYRKAFTLAQAAEIIKKDSGTYFDPKIVKIFFKIFPKVRKIT